MADGGNLAHAVDDLAFAGAEDLHQLHKGFFMGGEGNVVFHLDARLRLVADAAVHADSFTQTLSQHIFVGHIHQLILQRGAARVDNQYFHVRTPFILIQSEFCIARTSCLFYTIFVRSTTTKIEK